MDEEDIVEGILYFLSIGEERNIKDIKDFLLINDFAFPNLKNLLKDMEKEGLIEKRKIDNALFYDLADNGVNYLKDTGSFSEIKEKWGI
ncbi:MAG: helix-turn-helix domain-containing protein [Nanoarchaeota archaeon]|nr:helix-turn-helix domain-containing protein [Nanoarchaeota archaeon]